MQRCPCFGHSQETAANAEDSDHQDTSAAEKTSKASANYLTATLTSCSSVVMTEAHLGENAGFHQSVKRPKMRSCEDVPQTRAMSKADVRRHFHKVEQCQRHDQAQSTAPEATKITTEVLLQKSAAAMRIALLAARGLPTSAAKAVVEAISWLRLPL